MIYTWTFYGQIIDENGNVTPKNYKVPGSVSFFAAAQKLYNKVKDLPDGQTAEILFAQKTEEIQFEEVE